MSEFPLGMNAKAYFGAAGTALGALTEMTNIRDVTLSLESDEADVTTRGNSGWRATVPTLKSGTAEFEMQLIPGDAGLAAIREAWLTSTPLALAFLTGPRNVSGSEGPVANWGITNFSRSEPLEEAITYSVTAKIAVYTAWHAPA